jgi:PPK2 family polyphosphate:nucleotide phosphotransferase
VAPGGPDVLDRLRIKPGSRVSLSKWDPSETLGLDKAGAQPVLQRGLERLVSLQDRLWASKPAGLLVVLQGMDTSGKDGTIKHVMRAYNPQGVSITSFGVPSDEERGHDFLWRHHHATPLRGWVGIHNRSHYESVLIERVEELAPAKVWHGRYDRINEWEAGLSAEGTRIVKFMLHIDLDEQRARLQARLTDPTKQWKFNVDDLKVRARWDGYMGAYDDALTRCSTADSPWYVIPANRKWFRNLAVAEILCTVMDEMKLRFPDRTEELKGVVIE